MEKVNSTLEFSIIKLVSRTNFSLTVNFGFLDCPKRVFKVGNRKSEPHY